MYRVTIVMFCLAVLAGCVQYQDRRGVEVAWQPDIVSDFKRGRSTRRDVLDTLGPPSQVVSLEDETVLYYMFAQTTGEGLILLFYNTAKFDTRYDRAIFFFDKNDVLVDYSTRIQGRSGE